MILKRKFRTAVHYVRNNGFGSFARYCNCHYVKKTDSAGLVWGLSSKRRSCKIIVSLTSYPGRIDVVDQAIKSILAQSVKPDRIILWLASEQFPNKEADLPQQLLVLRDYGLEVMWCDDLRSHKKYFYAMQRFPEAAIVTFDDDLTYYPDTIEDLLRVHRQHPDCVICVRSHRMRFDEDGCLLPYREWDMCQSELVGVPSMALFSTSGAGTLYPPHCMDETLFDRDSVVGLCLNADDVWLKVAQVMKGTRVVSAREDRPLLYIDGTQDEGLYLDNLECGGNDAQLQAVFARYADWRSSEGLTLEESFRC